MLLSATVLLSSALVSQICSANPGPPTNLWYSSPFEAISTIFGYNLLTNLLWFSVALYFVWRMVGDRVGALPRTREKFFGSVAVVAIIVTALGAMIDFALLLQEYPFGYVLYFDSTNWAIAMALIFVSIYFSSLIFMNLDLRFALIPAGGITALNPVWWSLARSEGGEPLVFWTLVGSAILLPLFIALLWRLHGLSFPRPSRNEA